MDLTVFESKALIVRSHNYGCVLWYKGEHISREIDSNGTALEDLGLDSAPQGLSVWEGTYVSTSHYYDDDSGYSEPKGYFRILTGEELIAVHENRNPFETGEHPDGCFTRKSRLRDCWGDGHFMCRNCSRFDRSYSDTDGF